MGLFDPSFRFVAAEIDSLAFEEHVRFPNTERADIGVVVEIGKTVVDETMGSFISTNGVHDVKKSSILFESPIVDSDGRSGEVIPFRDKTSLHILDDSGICDDGLFFEVADETMASVGVEEIGEEEKVIEDTLGTEDHGSKEDGGSSKGHEGHQMHSLILSLF